MALIWWTTGPYLISAAAQCQSIRAWDNRASGRVHHANITQPLFKWPQILNRPSSPMPLLWAQIKRSELNPYVLYDVFKDVGIRTMTVNQRPPTIIMQGATPSMATAQHLFDSKDRILDPLNTLAELDKYIIEDVNLNNSTVHFIHSKMIQEVSITTTFFYNLFISPISAIQWA